MSSFTEKLYRYRSAVEEYIRRDIANKDCKRAYADMLYARNELLDAIKLLEFEKESLHQELLKYRR